MTNRIRRTTVEVRRLLPMEAEVYVTAELDAVTPAVELRGRLMGPKCPGVTTVEVAYPFRPLRGVSGLSALESSPPTLAMRAIIPEPNLWTEQTPYFYDGPLELWEDGRRCEVVQISVTLKQLRS